METRYVAARSANRATSSRSKAGMSATTRPRGLVAVAKRRLVDPRAAGIDEVVLDAEGAGNAPAGDDPGGDGDRAAVADDSDRHVTFLRRADGVHDGRGASHLVRRPTAGDDHAVEVVDRGVLGQAVRPDREAVPTPVGGSVSPPTETTSAPSSSRRMTVTRYSRSSTPPAPRSDDPSAALFTSDSHPGYPRRSVAHQAVVEAFERGRVRRARRVVVR